MVRVKIPNMQRRDVGFLFRKIAMATNILEMGYFSKAIAKTVGEKMNRKSS